MQPNLNDEFLSQLLQKPNPILNFKHPSIREKTVLITGAGGSIGSHLSKEIARLGAKKIILIDHSELHLYQINECLKKINHQHWNGDINIEVILASTTDDQEMRRTFSQHNPEWVFHAAAYKHVHLVQLNPRVALNNNVYGSYLPASLAIEFGVEKFILVSTDKAVEPVNVMGASKTLAEMMIIALAEKSHETQFSIARFGNVIGSSGSLIPKIMHQMIQGEPVSIAHPVPSRYFMMMTEAIEFLLQLLNFDESGCEIYARDMGKPYNILDLAKRLSLLLDCQDKVHFKQIDILPYEKIDEVCLMNADAYATFHPKIFQIPIHTDLQHPLPDLLRLLEDCQNNPEQIDHLVKRFIPTIY
jgi:FlaA1/EpsC-like NDP-sugar epimerase